LGGKPEVRPPWEGGQGPLSKKKKGRQTGLWATCPRDQKTGGLKRVVVHRRDFYEKTKKEKNAYIGVGVKVESILQGGFLVLCLLIRQVKNP